MANSFAQSTLVKEELAFQFSQFLGVGKYVDWSYTSEFKGEVNAGYTRWLRRPSLYDSTNVGIGGDYSLPGYTVGSDWQAATEPTFPLTLTGRYQTKLQVGFEELIYRLSKNQFRERHIEGALTALGSQIQQDIANQVVRNVGASLGTPGASIVGSTFQDEISNARILMNSRGCPSAKRRRILLQPNAVTPLQKQAFTQYHSGPDVDMAWRSGKFGHFADFEIDDCYALPSVAVPALGSDLAYSFPDNQGTDQSGNTYTWPLTVWYPTCQVTVSGLTPATGTIKAGTQLFFSGVNWSRPFTHIDTGTMATFTVAQDATITSNSATIVFKEPIIASGPYQNVTTLPVSGTNKLNFLGTGATGQASLAFAEGAIVGASPIPPVPDGVKSMIIKAGGVNIALWQDHFAGSNQNITMMYAIYGVAVATPEWCVNLY